MRKIATAREGFFGLAWRGELSRVDLSSRKTGPGFFVVMMD